MSESNPIKGSDIIEEGALSNAIEQAQKLTLIYSDLEKGIKAIAGSSKSFLGVDPKSVKDIQEQTKAIEKANTVYKSKLQLTKEQLVLREKEKILNRQAIKDAQFEAKEQLGLITQYDRENKLLNELITRKKQLEDQNKQTSLSYKVVSTSITELDGKLKGFDASVGRHHRNVGNYQDALKNLGGGLGGVTGLLAGLGHQMGIETEFFEQMHEVSKELIKTTKEFSHALHLQHLAGHEHEVGLKAEAVAVKEEAVAEVAANEAKSASIPIIGLVIAGLTALGAVIYHYIELSKEEQLNEMERSKAMDGRIVENEKLRNLYNDHIEAVAKLADGYAVLNGEMTEYDATIKEIARKTTREVIDAHNEGLKEVQEAAHKGFLDYGRDYLRMALIPLTMGASLLADKSEEVIKERTNKARTKMNDEIKALIRKGEDEAKAKRLEEEKREKEDDKRRIERAKETQIKINRIKSGQDFDVPLFDEGEMEQRDADRKLIQDRQKSYDEWWDQYTFNKDQKAKAKAEADRQDRKYRMIAEQQMILEEFQKMFDQKIAMEQAYNQRQLDMANSQINTQAQLAAAGQKNTLDFQYAERAKALDREKQLEKKAHREKEAMELAQIFLEFEKVYASKDGGAGAAGKALTQTLIAKGIAYGLSGAFAEEGGIVGEMKEEPLFARKHKSGNDRLVQAEDGEGIIPRLKMRELGLDNKEAFNKFLSKGNLFNPNMVISDNSALISEIKDLKQVVKDKKEMYIQRDVLRGMIQIIEKENGTQRTYNQVPSQIIKRGTYNA